MDPIFKFQMGEEARDMITGFKGIIVARVEFITGCANYKLQPQELDTNGKVKEPELFDENRLEIVGEGVKLPNSNTPQEEEPEEAKKVTKGGPQQMVHHPNRI